MKSAIRVGFVPRHSLRWVRPRAWEQSSERLNAAVDTSKLEEEIYQLVYQLYGLAEEETKIVEGK